MGRGLTELQVLKKLDIDDFRHLTKDKVMTMATMLDKMDPEVAKKALEQFPEFASTMRQVLADFKQTLDEGLKINSEETKSIYASCDVAIVSCQEMLKIDNLTFEQRSYILQQMLFLIKIKSEKNTENKKFIATMNVIAFAAAGFAAGALIASIGGDLKFDIGSVKKIANK